MSTEAQIAAFEGGQLRVLSPDVKSREAVLALSLNRLLVKMVRVPAEDDPVEFAAPLVQSLSPFPDEPLTVSCETVHEDDSGKTVIAMAFPDTAADDIGEALDAAKLNVVRIDALLFGLLRGVWSALGDGDGRRLVLVNGVDCVEMIVLDRDQPMAMRAVAHGADMRREVMLLLLEAENFGGVRGLSEIVVVKKDGDDSEVESLETFAPVREITVGADAALVGIAERDGDANALNALPASWREVLEEVRFKAKMVKCLAVAGGIWLFIMAVLFGVPMGYNFMTGRQKDMSRQHARQYNAVKEMKAKVDVIHKYSDHARGALEIMKVISDSLPDGITLQSWNYKRDDGISVRGEAESAEEVYTLKDKMDELTVDGEADSEKIFGTVELKGPNASKSKNLYSFDLNCQYRKDDAE